MKLASPCTLAPPLLRPRCTAALPAQLGRCKHSACTPARATSADAACTTASCIQGSGYAVSAEDCALFHSQGWGPAVYTMPTLQWPCFLVFLLYCFSGDLLVIPPLQVCTPACCADRG